MPMLVLAALLVLLPAPFVQAQPLEAPETFSALRSRVAPGTTVDVELESGARVRGLLEAVEDARLSIRDGRDIRWLDATDVVGIDTRHRDSVLNGLLIGAGVGGAVALGIISDNALCSYNCQFVSGALVYTGIGAGLGAALDALVQRATPVYRRGGRAPRLAVGVGEGRAGRSVTLGLSY